MSATSRSRIRCSVVHAVPRPRARAASMKLHVAGRMLPSIDAEANDGRPSRRAPALQAMTSVGASPIRSPRKSADVWTRFCWAFSTSVCLLIDPTYAPSIVL